jgi:uncharacterized protein (DUF1697 family)
LRYVAFLRGINVGGKNIIKMEALKKSFESAGFTNVKTFIQCGNVLFDSTSSSTPALTKKIEKKLREDYGSDIKTMIRSMDEIEEMQKQSPFCGREGDKSVKLYVCFLYENIPAGKKLPSVSEKDAVEIVRVGKKEIYFLSFPTKNGRYGFPNNFIENEFKTFSTVRNWNTIKRLLASN